MDLRSTIKRVAPPKLHPALRYARLLAIDLWEVATGSRRPLTPPRRKVESIGGFDFIEVGEHLLDVAKRGGLLDPTDDVLDAGSGLGRFAVPLLDYLTTGTYEGFDIDRWAVRWSRANITARRGAFRFTRIDVRNDHYNPKGRIEPADLVFPYDDAAFDFVFAASLFTHLLPDAAARYVDESVRVLRPGGRFFASFFLLDDVARAALAEGAVDPAFIAPENDWAIADPDDPEAAVAYDERVVREELSRRGLDVETIHHGRWPRRAEGLSFQDFVLARRRS